MRAPHYSQLPHQYLDPQRSGVKLLPLAPKSMAMLRADLYAYLVSVGASRTLDQLLELLFLDSRDDTFMPLLSIRAG